MYVPTLVLDLFQELKCPFFIINMCIIAFRPNSPLGNEKLDFLSNPIPLPEYPYLSISAFLVNVTAANKQFFSAGSSE